MAATTIKPYPHIQINVKDNSIATIEYVERLPVHRALYVMRTKKGPLGEPTWCNTYSEAAAIFGAETFDPANKEYFSRPSLFLRNTLTRNGAFITRYLPGDNTTANIVLMAKLQYKQLQSTTETVTDPDTGEETEVTTESLANVKLPQYTYSAGTGYREQEWVEDNQEWEDKKSGSSEDGLIISYYTRLMTAGEESDGINPDSFVPNPETGIWELPIAVFRAKYAGGYGNDLAFKLFYTPKSNDPGDVEAYDTIFYNIGFAERESSQSTWNPITDIYGRENCAFAANPETINPDTGASMGVDYVLDKGFSDSLHILPVDFEIFESSFRKIGIVIATFEEDEIGTDGKLVGKSLNGYDDFGQVGGLTATEKIKILGYLYGPAEGEETVTWDDVKDSFDKSLGYRVNVISGKNLLNVPYDHVKIESTADLIQAENHALQGGFDGTIIPEEGLVEIDETTGKKTYYASSDDTAMYEFCKLRLFKLKDKIVESLRYPFTHLFDVGYSMKTKYAMLDFLDVRDDVMVILSAQALMNSGDSRSIKVFENDPAEAQAQDEANTEALRSYALLMRESVLYGTDCMRASIYEHTGKLVNSVYTGFVPFTYWVAEQYAQYGNLTYMSQVEPRGLPNSYNLLFKSWNWNNYRADAQSRVWDEGGNYVQYADMTRIFYPSLRTVYRAATSVLIDEWVVASVVYAKYVCRRAWARFSGRNDYAATLQSDIKKYLDTELGILFNGKYTFETTVYQTAEEKELGYIQHVKLSITYGATMRVLDVDIEVNREGFTPGE